MKNYDSQDNKRERTERKIKSQRKDSNNINLWPLPGLQDFGESWMDEQKQQNNETARLNTGNVASSNWVEHIFYSFIIGL